MPERPRQRLLVRGSSPILHVAVGGRVRRVAAGVAVVVLAAALVIGLGLLAGLAESLRADEGSLVVSPASTASVVTVTVGAQRTLWEVARAVAPVASGPELGAIVGRIVTTNSLTTVRLAPGQVLVVPLA